ncbi:MAG: nucleotidyl transferase AbiEii/AbiGii toxin family protein [Coxiellaceae bacterium]|nr:nucleotidyl transferase AbiEii/AbiGii toxin family protein [Coxiellaceae bacterium]
MISITEQELRFEAETKGYRPEILEKVYRLLGLLDIFMATPYLKKRLVLKGGTAINLFCTANLPRLSLDIDFNYVGSIDRQVMLAEKVAIKRVILDLCRRQGYTLYRNPGAHAGGKMILIYTSLLGANGRLELDLNYLYRRALWPVQWMQSKGWMKSVGVNVLDIHELAAGKLCALLEREAARDLYDSHNLLTQWGLDNKKLRQTFTVYAGMRKGSWRQINVDMIQYSVKGIRNKLIPVLRRDIIPGTTYALIERWADDLVTSCKQAFQSILPFNEPEKDFLQSIEEYGEIRPEFLSADEVFCEAVSNHPALRWRALQAVK